MAPGNDGNRKREELVDGSFNSSMAGWCANSDHHLAGSIAPLAWQGISSVGVIEQRKRVTPAPPSRQKQSRCA